ncbi:MAG: MerR family transcriptional regulator [Ilumatobacter coccineus]|uniref:MerR family transcriptional regulator n=1 Tax=Ilumatobacter coccineus TaxID=467094 RepID=A0A2G6K8T2_9ACTN|nr:MAG: MerR family transcriptional regulator [Ilumatobacter coccineus]
MPTDDQSLFSIGPFSRATSISVRMLRYYDENQVLTPAFTDPSTGYRYYSLSQLRDAARIRTLRDLGLGVSALAALVKATPDELAAALAHHRHQLADDAHAATERLQRLDNLLAIQEELPMTLDIQHTTHPAQTVITLRRVIDTYADEGDLWNEMMAALGPDAFSAFCGPGMAIFHDPDYKESDVDVEIAMPVSRPLEVNAPLECVTHPEREVVVATLNGSYDQMPEVVQAAAQWATTNGFTLAGSMHNRYVVSPAQTQDPSAWVTEVCLPVMPT